MCFMSCLAHVLVMTAAMQMRQSQEEGETQEEEKPQGGRNPKEPQRALHTHPEHLSTKKG